MAEWTWDPDDFAALWLSNANDRFPRPLHYRSRFAYSEDFDAHRSTVRERYSRDELEQIQLALHTLTTSDLRIEIRGGTTKHRSGNGMMREYRIVGARNLYHAVVLFQSAINGEDGPIRLRMCRTDALPARIVNFLPGCNPGGMKPATFHVQDLDPRRDDYFENATRNAAREQYNRLLGRSSDGGGSAGLLVGSILDRPDPRNTVRWYDISGDGRYTERRTADHIKIRPTTPQELSLQFTSWIDGAVQRLREDADDAL